MEWPRFTRFHAGPGYFSLLPDHICHSDSVGIIFQYSFYLFHDFFTSNEAMLLLFFGMPAQVIAQSFLQHANDGNPEAAIRTITFACRLIVYLGNIPFLLVTHVQKMRASIREGEMVKIGRFRYPIYLQKAGNVCRMGLLVCLILMHTYYLL